MLTATDLAHTLEQVNTKEEESMIMKINPKNMCLSIVTPKASPSTQPLPGYYGCVAIPGHCTPSHYYNYQTKINW